MSQEKKRVEEVLREFTPRPAPPELKPRVLAASEPAREREFFFTRFQWRAAAALGLLALASLIGDVWFEGRSARAWRALITGMAPLRAMDAGIDRDLIREISGDDRNLEKQILSRLDAEIALRRFSRPAFGVLPGDY